MQVDFYHLAATPIERVLPRICERLIAAGERLLVVAAPEPLEELDRLLWSCSRTGFLPHGVAGRDDASTQPILLAEEPTPTNTATNIALADGRWREEALAFNRAFFFFDATTIDNARTAWRMLDARDEVERRYWKQQDGRWVQGP